VSGNALLVGAWDGNLSAFSDQTPPVEPKVGTREIGRRRRRGVAEAYRVKAGEDGEVASLSFYVEEGSSAAKLVAGLYEDDGGHPSELIDSGAVTPAQGWSAVAPSATVKRDERYWIGALGTGGALKVRNHAGGGRRPARDESQERAERASGDLEDRDGVQTGRPAGRVRRLESSPDFGWKRVRARRR
jgi:hypothetical protein